jgi:hypothetical protein
MTTDGTAAVKAHEIEYEANPFWPGTNIQTRMKRTRLQGDQQVVVNLRTGLYEGKAEMVKAYEVDADQFIKVFVATLMVFFEVENSGRKVLEYAMLTASQNADRDRLYLHWEDCQKYHHITRGNTKGVSRASFYNGIQELAEKGILAKANRKNFWWINPAVFWNGDRVSFRTEMKKAAEILPPNSAPKGNIRDAQGIDHLAEAFTATEDEALPEILRMAAE